jgi:cytochrome P450
VIDSQIDLASPSAVADPFAAFAELRRQGPVVWLPAQRAWFFSTYSAVSEGFKDRRLSSDRLTPIESRLDATRREVLDQTIELLRGWMVFHDEPDHARLRDPLKRAFTPRRVEALRPRVSAVVHQLLGDLDDDGPVDLIGRFAFPLPAIVIAELLGVPPEDRERFKTWSDKLAGLVFGASGDARADEVVASGSAEFADYFGWLIRRYTDEPADNLVSALIAVSRSAGDGDRPALSSSELVGTCTLLLFGGHETTTNLIGNSVHSLLRHPDQLAALRRDPETVAGAVEELHRYDGSTKLMVRIVGEDHERAGQQLRAGQTVFLGVSSANRDPAAFDQPDDLRLDRPDAHRHLGFGFGAHFCLGAYLARVETQQALAALVTRYPALTLAADESELAWRPTLISRGPARLPVAVR